MSRAHSNSRYVTREADWSDNPDMKQWLRDEVFVGEVLNFPSGVSDLGDVQADRDPSADPDVVADLYNHPFDEQSFDTVYCDPPYSFYGGDQFNFVNPLWDIARKRLVFQTNRVGIHLKHSKKKWFVNEAVGRGMAVVLLQAFERPDAKLDEFGGDER